MGMLMHHTWLNQQNEQKPEKVEKPSAEKAEETAEPVGEPVKRGRKKTTNTK